MSKSKIFPESYYTFNDLSYEELLNAFNNNLTVLGFVEKICTDSGELLIKFGEGLFGRLPFDEVTIYPFSYSSNPNRPLPIQICTLLHKNVRVKITQCDGNNIKLSRKSNMLEAYEHLKDCSSVLFNITNTTLSMAFGDIGDGIVACMHIKEVCKTRIKNISEYFHPKDNVWVNVLSYDNLRQFRVSYKSTFPAYKPEDFHHGDVYKAKICNPLDKERSAYFVEISPNITGIMTTTELTPLLKYGDFIECRVRRADPRGLKLQFIRLMN